jgi:hypothetical protein
MTREVRFFSVDKRQGRDIVKPKDVMSFFINAIKRWSESMKNSKPDRDLQPATELWHMLGSCEPKYAFKATNAAAARLWQKATRKALAEKIGLGVIPTASASPRKIESVDKQDYIREKILIRTGPRCLMPVYLL